MKDVVVVALRAVIFALTFSLIVGDSSTIWYVHVLDACVIVAAGILLEGVANRILTRMR